MKTQSEGHLKMKNLGMPTGTTKARNRKQEKKKNISGIENIDRRNGYISKRKCLI